MHGLVFLIIAQISLKYRLILSESVISHTHFSSICCFLTQSEDSECYQDNSIHCSHPCLDLISVLLQMFEKHNFLFLD